MSKGSVMKKDKLYKVTGGRFKDMIIKYKGEPRNGADMYVFGRIYSNNGDEEVSKGGMVVVRKNELVSLEKIKKD